MMDKYGFSLREVNSFGSSINLGLWVAFTMGFVYDKYGPKFSCILGALLLSGSYIILYFILTSSIKSISILFFLLIGLLMGQGSALCYTTAITTNLKNFKIKETSIIVGLLVANMAISPSIITTYKEYLENVNIANYFLLISIFLTIIILICGVVFTNIKDLYSNESKLMDYQKYKEKNVIFLLLILNFITLIVYIFGVMYNYSNNNSSFPNFIVYPCLQSLNFVFLILERLKVFDYFYFREFITKEVNKKIILEDINYQNEIN
jgi:MFS family permease